MSDLFAKIYLDEDVNVVIANILRSRQFNAVTTREANRRSRADAGQLEFASANGFTLLTHNRDDFQRLAKHDYENSLHHCGIIIAVRRPVPEIVRCVLVLLDQHSADEFKDQTFYI